MQVRKDLQGLDLPGGHVETRLGEEKKEGAIRETLEESGLLVELGKELGEPLQVIRGDEGEDLVTTHLFEAKVISGSLRTSNETTGFVWVSLSTLDSVVLMGKPESRYPKGIMYEMVIRALSPNYTSFSCVNDPDKLAKVA